MKAIRINEIGGPEVMQLEEIETPTPQEGAEENIAPRRNHDHLVIVQSLLVIKQ